VDFGRQRFTELDRIKIRLDLTEFQRVAIKDGNIKAGPINNALPDVSALTYRV
jgi:hypothetical protein